MVPRDTTGEAWTRHFDALRAMGPQERLRLAVAASDEVREIARAGIRHRNPEWDDVQVQQAFEKLILGEDIARAARESRLPARR